MGDLEQPHRRRESDKGLRALLTPKTVIVALLTVAGFGITTGKWVGASEHNDAELTKQIAQVNEKIDTMTAHVDPDVLDRRYVSRESYELQLQWIKEALQRIEARQTGQALPSRAAK